MKNDKLKIRPWRYEEKPDDPITVKQREMMEQKNKPNYEGVYRR